jgi:hypothetical protein
MTEDLAFDLGQRAQMVGVDENVPPVLERCEQRRRLLEVETATVWRPGAWRHSRERSGTALQGPPSSAVRPQGESALTNGSSCLRVCRTLSGRDAPGQGPTGAEAGVQATMGVTAPRRTISSSVHRTDTARK